MKITLASLGAWTALSALVVAQDGSIPSRLTLTEALRIAVERNPLQAAARNEVERVEAARLAATTRPNPALTVEGEGYPLFESDRPSFFGDQELTIRYDQELEISGRRALRTQAADAAVEVAGAGADDRRRRLLLAVRSTYFQVCTHRPADCAVGWAPRPGTPAVAGVVQSSGPGHVAVGTRASHHGNTPAARAPYAERDRRWRLPPRFRGECRGLRCHPSAPPLRPEPWWHGAGGRGAPAG